MFDSKQDSVTQRGGILKYCNIRCFICLTNFPTATSIHCCITSQTMGNDLALGHERKNAGSYTSFNIKTLFLLSCRDSVIKS